MAFRLSQRSRRRLEGVHQDLVRVVERAIALTVVDFQVAEGLRSKERQAQLVARGASQTMASRHLTGHAVDLVALDGLKVSWQWEDYFAIARAMRHAAAELAIPVRWGGCWQELGSIASPEEGVADYVSGCRRQRRRAFMDGPHFELPAEYPA